jgi:hypothetical protein
MTRERDEISFYVFFYLLLLQIVFEKGKWEVFLLANELVQVCHKGLIDLF